MDQNTPLFISLPFSLERSPPPFSTNEDKYPESLVRYFLNKYTKKGDNVLDPFMGLGTTAFVCEEMNRTPYGIEYDRKRFEWVAGQIENWTNIMHDSAANILEYNLPKMDFCITSPPYMPKHHKWNPLYGGDPKYAGYDNYLKRIAYIYTQITKIMKRNSYLVVQLDNLQHRGGFTPLVKEVGNAIEKSMRLDSEIIIAWEKARPDYLHTHCLLFKNVRK